MKQKGSWFAVGIIAILSALAISWYWSAGLDPSRSGAPEAASPNPNSPDHEHSTAREDQTASSDQDQTAPNQPPEVNAETQALSAMTQILKNFGQTGRGMNSLVEHLSETGQEPTVVTQSNPYTGDMTIVRTDRPLPGTRYFHAQFFSDNGGKNEHVQHMSFEFRPSEAAFESVVQNLKQTFHGLGEPTHQNDGFTSWNLGEGYVLWVNRLKSEDLKDHPFNAYTPEDVGTIRVAVEQEIHGEDHDH